MPRTLSGAIAKLRPVRCSACDRPFLSSVKPPRLCPACKRKGRLLGTLRKLTRG